ncbi:T9SS type B sorting domain-containing protein [Filimonas effusa]|uniref:T9SS type B sorting domain-containing protein n=1 Tax=Filimonas effusa TaxID=2508721 RepID=A0A4Q1DCE0_9BACT|nr:gliding motility-associated C-terminal domain-containing protein [Filimonas effusa]RXK87161.1 T9SS type B sorting domain-containing protein [Filimonas effusa]
MFLKYAGLLLVTLCLSYVSLKGQTTCTTLGQTPETAFPVCGTSVFHQSNVPNCGGRKVVTPPDCANLPYNEYTDINPFWYKFTCFQGGTLGFEIKPVSTADDYDWQLFDVTGKAPSAVFSDASTYVSSNWSGEKTNNAVTGASSAGTMLTVCGTYTGGPLRPMWSSMPTLIQGHDYLLLISNFSHSQKGYDLTFKGGTAVITDPTPPSLLSGRYLCEAKEFRIKLNKKMRCSTLAKDGSDFSVNAPGISIISASGVNCSSGFDTDSVILVFDKQPTSGNYQVTVKTGSDGNTVLDNCNVGIAVGASIAFSVAAPPPGRIDSLTPFSCAPEQLHVVFTQPVNCATIAANGSNFAITGPYPVNITAAIPDCKEYNAAIGVTLTLDRAMVNGGIYTLNITNGTGGDPLSTLCGGDILPGSTSINFEVKDTVSAAFTYTLALHCDLDTIALKHDGAHGVNSWRWFYDDNKDSSHRQNPLKIYDKFGVKTIRLIVTNGLCSDTASQSIDLSNVLEASFTMSSDTLCPNEIATFTNTSTGKIVGNRWDFGHGGTSLSFQPPRQSYPLPKTRRQIYPVKLIVQSNMNCYDTAVHMLTVLNSCFVAVPTAFTPNGDGRNDYLYPLNAFRTLSMEFKVYNRYGQLVFTTKEPTGRWDGRFKGEAQPPGTYIWEFNYVDKETGQPSYQKGTAVLIR